MNRILLVDDDVELTDMLADYLAAEGFEVVAAHDGVSAVDAALAGACDVMVLDVMLPGQSGMDALRAIRQSSDIPVLMLTAKGDDIDRIVGLELGADDYLPKPCNPRELVARLRAILRRMDRGEGARASGPVLAAGRASLDPARRVARWDGDLLELTSTEFNVLEVLMRNAGHVVGKAELCEQALGRALERYDRSLDMHISNLRRKLGVLADGRSPIQTVRGVGFQFISE